MTEEVQTLFVRSVPKSVVSKIKQDAKKNRMSMAGVVIKMWSCYELRNSSKK